MSPDKIFNPNVVFGIVAFAVIFFLYVSLEISGKKTQAREAAEKIAGETWNIVSAAVCTKFLKLTIRNLDGKEEHLIVFSLLDFGVDGLLDARNGLPKTVCFTYFPNGKPLGRKTDVSGYLQPRRAV